MKGHVIMVSSSEKDLEGDVSMQLEGEHDLVKMAQRVQKNFKFKTFMTRAEISNNK